MLNQYGMVISVVVADFSDAWMDYMWQGSCGVSNPHLLDRHILRMHRFGEFRIDDAQDMHHLSVLLAAILVKDQGDPDVVSVLDLTGKGKDRDMENPVMISRIVDFLTFFS
jgi:hypothetical protein